MKNIKKFENFEGFMADEEADQMANDQIYADREAQDAERMKEDEIYSSFLSKKDLNSLLDKEDEADEIVARFEEEFGHNDPTAQEFAEFYHMLRTEGIDGIKIFSALEGLIPENEDEEENDELPAYDADEDAERMKEDEIYSSMEEEDEAQYERKSLKRFNDFK